jgi:hypothetical protein
MPERCHPRGGAFRILTLPISDRPEKQSGENTQRRHAIHLYSLQRKDVHGLKTGYRNQVRVRIGEFD